MTVIRVAGPDDVPGIAAIYDHEVATGISTFDLTPPSTEYWMSHVSDAAPGHPFLVADNDGEVVGFAYASTYRPRPGYRLTRETSVYLADGARGRGLGRVLYDDLLPRLRADGMHTALALIALPNPASVALHEACGFAHVGTMLEVGHKFDDWIDTAWYQLIL